MVVCCEIFSIEENWGKRRGEGTPPYGWGRVRCGFLMCGTAGRGVDYLRFWLSSCRTSLAVSALRIMRYCPNTQSGCSGGPMVCIGHYKWSTRRGIWQ